MPDHCRTALVADAPADLDAFGPHERVAKALAEMIRSEEGGKSVALEGGWGAGKSTVIKLLRSQLKGDQASTVVVFDAWSHQGDPLRRTFLERLIHHLQDVKWIAKSREWTARLEALSKRRRVTETRNTPVLTEGGKALALSLLLVAPGIAFLNAALREQLGQAFWVYLIAGAILTFSPVMVLLVARLRSKTDETWALFAQKQVTETRSETIETPEPTSLEFERTFSELMREALDGDEKRRLALVVDNLDRVSPEDAKAIWATLQTFLQRSGHAAPSWFSQLWLLVPFDRGGISRIWDFQEKRQGRADERASDLASSFLDKTFQIRVEIPPPVLSKWRPYLEDLLKVALPDHDEAQFHNVYRLLELRRRSSGTPPTPRDLKLYVNEIGAIHRQWQDSYPLSDIAYYVLLRREGRDIPAELRDRKVPEKELVGLLDAKIRDNLAALAFNVDVALGRELLLQEPIVAALSEGDAAALNGLAGSFPGFWEVLEHVLEDRLSAWAAETPVSVANAARCFTESEILQRTKHASSRSVKTAFRGALKNLKTWPRLDAGAAKGIAAIWHLLQDEDAAKHLIKTLNQSSVAEGAQPEKGPKVTEWTDSALELLRAVKGTAMEGAVGDGFVVPTATAGYLETCGHLASADPSGEFWRSFRPKQPLTEVGTALVQIISSGHTDPDLAAVVEVIAASRPKFPWADVIKQVVARLSPNVSPPDDELSGLLGILWELESSDAGSQALSQVTTQGHLHHHLHAVASRGHLEAKSWLTFSILTIDPKTPNPPGVGSSASGYSQLLSSLRSDDEKLARQVTQLALRYRDGEWFFKILAANKEANALISTCLKGIAEGGDAPQVFQPRLVIKSWKVLRQHLSAGFPALVKRLMDESGLLQELLASEFEPTQAGLCVALTDVGLSTNQAFIVWCSKGLENLASDVWTKQIETQGELVALLLALGRNNVQVTLSHAYEDALIAIAKLSLKDGWVPKRFAENWKDLFQPLRNPHIRKTFRSRLYDLVGAREGDISEAFFALYGAELGDHEILVETRRAVSQLFIPLLTKRNAPGLLWLRESLASTVGLLDRFPNNEVADFKVRLRDAVVRDPGDPASPQVRAIASLLGVDLTPPAPETPPAPATEST